MKVTLIGCGRVGLVSGACLAEIGHHVVCTDRDQSKIHTLNCGQTHFYERYLDELIQRGRHNHRLRFSSEAGEAVYHGEVVFICVNTPPLESGDADLTALDHVAKLIAHHARASQLVVEKSTVPVRTGQQLRRALSVYNRNPRVNFLVASNPEFLREGTAVGDFLHPNRIVVGVEEPQAEKMLRELYQPLQERNFDCPVHERCPPADPCPFVVTSIESAELIKHASNSFLALKISYANALADLCERVGADVEQVAYAMGLDPRIGPDFLRAGLGFGGFCLPKDIQAFIRLAEQAGMDFALLREAERINKQRIERILEKVRDALWVLKDKQVGLLGLAFKANTDDIRFAPSLDMIQRLLAEGALVRAYDPQAMANTRAVYPSVQYAADPYEVASGADAVLVVTDWDDFRTLDWERVYRVMNRPLIIDGRNLLDPIAMAELGFEYYSVGRPALERKAPRRETSPGSSRP